MRRKDKAIITGLIAVTFLTTTVISVSGNEVSKQELATATIKAETINTVLNSSNSLETTSTRLATTTAPTVTTTSPVFTTSTAITKQTTTTTTSALPTEALSITAIDTPPAEASPITAIDASPVEASPIIAIDAPLAEASPITSIDASPVEASTVTTIDSSPVEATTTTSTQTTETTTTTTSTQITEETTLTTTVIDEYYWNGPVLDSFTGTILGPSGTETYYNLDMSGVISIMQSLGYDYDYEVREDGVKTYGGYVMCAADLSIRPRGTIVDTSLGKGIVCDTGGFVEWDSTRLDIATDW